MPNDYLHFSKPRSLPGVRVLVWVLGDLFELGIFLIGCKLNFSAFGVLIR